MEVNDSVWPAAFILLPSALEISARQNLLSVFKARMIKPCRPRCGTFTNSPAETERPPRGGLCEIRFR